LLKPDDPRLQGSFYGVANAQWAVGDLSKRESTYRQALEMVERSRQPDEQIHLWILNDQAIFAKERKDYKSAVALMRESLRIRERIYPENHPDRIMGVSNLAEILVLAGERQEARGYLQAALDSQERTLGPDDWQVASILHSLGELERQEGQLNRARALLERSIAIFDKPRNNKNPAGAEILASLGLVDEAQGRLAEAIDHYGRAYEIYVSNPSYSARDRAPDYVRVLRNAGRIAEAKRIESAAMKQPSTNNPYP